MTPSSNMPEPSSSASTGYSFSSTAASHTEAYLWGHVFRELESVFSSDGEHRVFDLGCGNGALMAALRERGYDVTGVDPSESGIRLANQRWPDLNAHLGSAYDALRETFGQFPAVVSLEVVEHVYAPRDYARTLFDLLTPGGTAIVSTPYHGYLKNLVLAITGKMDSHFTALWDHGHIKFWSVKTLTTLLHEIGFQDIRFVYAGRVPILAKSMIAIARRPQA